MFKSLKKKIESDPHQEIHLASNKKPGGPIRLSAATSDDESNETKRCEPNQSLNADEEELARTTDDEKIPEVFVEPKLSDSKNVLAIKTKQMKELRTMIGLLEEKIAHLQGEVESESRAKDESNVKLEEMRDERDELKKRIDDLANEKDEERTRFDERCTDLEKELSDKAKDLESAAVELQKTNEKKTVAEVLNGKLRQEKSKFEEKILALEKRLRETEMTEGDQIQSLLQEREQLKETVADFQRKTTETESLKLQLEDARKIILESTSRIDDLERQNESEVSFNETLKSQLAEALSVSAERERLIATLQMSISTTLTEEKAAREGLQTEIQTLKCGLEKSQQSQAVLKELQKHHEELQSRSVDRERELERIVQERDEAWAERDALKRESEAQKSVTMTRDRLESAETQQLGVEYDQLLAEANGTHDKSIADKQQTIEELAEQVELLEARIRMQNDSEFSLVNSEHLPEKVTQLRKENSDLKSQLIEKNKAIKMQQQKLTDLKKALHRELKGQDLPDGSRTGQDCHSPNINSEYLKHVILRFFCSSNEEARQLIKAVSAVLRFTPREERCVIEWLNYKTSWFGSQPKSPIGGIR